MSAFFGMEALFRAEVGVVCGGSVIWVGGAVWDGRGVGCGSERNFNRAMSRVRASKRRALSCYID